MQVTIPGHLFAQLPFYDVIDTDDTVVVDLQNREDLVNIRGALQVGWSPRSSTWQPAGWRSSTPTRERAPAPRTCRFTSWPR
jgi:hypothetical protein